MLSYVSNVAFSSSLDSYLPQGFKDLEMEMSFEEVQKVRPFTKTTGKEGKAYEKISKKTKKRFFEIFDDSRIESELKAGTVRYKFDDNKLKEIEFSMSGIDCNSNSLFRRIKAAAEKTYGQAEYCGNKNCRWENNDIEISLDVSGSTYRCLLEYKLTQKEPM